MYHNFKVQIIEIRRIEMLLLNKKDIEKSVDLEGMIDQIEEAYKIF